MIHDHICLESGCEMSFIIYRGTSYYQSNELFHKLKVMKENESQTLQMNCRDYPFMDQDFELVITDATLNEVIDPVDKRMIYEVTLKGVVK